VESPNGLEAGGSGLSATLRDLGRFGLFVAGGGRVGETRILPEGWMDEATKPLDIPIHFAGQKLPYDYGYMWWLPKPEKGEIHKGAYAAAGIFGQFLYVNPREKLVIVLLSSQSKPVPPPYPLTSTLRLRRSSVKKKAEALLSDGSRLAKQRKAAPEKAAFSKTTGLLSFDRSPG
jgi:CubicO group peptidase (beta-lactamase class C family)